MIFCKKTYIKVLLLSVLLTEHAQVDAVIAPDPEINALSGLALKQRAQFYKDHTAPAHHRHFAPGGVPTDTDLLLQGMTAGNNNAYVAAAKAGIKLAVGAWINSLLAPDGVFVERRATLADTKRDTFKAALDLAIDGVVSATAASADANLLTLRRTKNAINAEMVAALNAQIDVLATNPAQFIRATVATGGAGQPADRTSNAFKAALAAVVRQF